MRVNKLQAQNEYNTVSRRLIWKIHYDKEKKWCRITATGIRDETWFVDMFAEIAKGDAAVAIKP